MEKEIFAKWRTQLRKGYLELCVLTALGDSNGNSYGFEMLQRLERAGLDINEGTLYPLLNRMHRNKWLDSYWETPEGGGHPRRFYGLSEQGRQLRPQMTAIFNDYNDSLEMLAKGAGK